MVMTGATALMSGGGPNPGMMGPGVMMDMSGMMGPMGIGMNGDMGMGMQPGGPMMQVDGRQMMGVDGRGMMQVQDGGQGQGGGIGVSGGGVVGVGGSGTPEQGGGVGVQMMQDGFGGAGGPGMMGMGMGGDFGMQVGIGALYVLGLADESAYLVSFITGSKPNEPTDVPKHGWPSQRPACTKRTWWDTYSLQRTRHDTRHGYAWARFPEQRSWKGRTVRGRWWYV